VPYYHVVFTLPAPIGDIAYHNKAAIYGILFKTAAEISEATGTRAVRQRSTSGEHSPVRQYVFSSCLPRSRQPQERNFTYEQEEEQLAPYERPLLVRHSDIPRTRRYRSRRCPQNVNLEYSESLQKAASPHDSEPVPQYAETGFRPTYAPHWLRVRGQQR
jgi:hypothetical protein